MSTVIEPGFKILTKINANKILSAIEDAGRTCYKPGTQEGRISDPKRFIKNIITRGHESVLEHQSISVRIICDRAATHEIVRHRMASYSQESQRYCNYSKENSIIFIKPCFWEEGSKEFNIWKSSCQQSEAAYLDLISMGAKPELARTVLPNSVKTELVMTANIREWRHFFKLRAIGISGRPHPQLLEITVPMLEEFKKLLPVLFDDLEMKNA